MQKWKYLMDTRGLGPLPRPLQFISKLGKFCLGHKEEMRDPLERAQERLSKLELARTNLSRKMKDKAVIVKERCARVESARDAIARRNNMYETAIAENPSLLLHEQNEENDELERKISRLKTNWKI